MFDAVSVIVHFDYQTDSSVSFASFGSDTGRPGPALSMPFPKHGTDRFSKELGCLLPVGKIAFSIQQAEWLGVHYYWIIVVGGICTEQS